MRGDPPRTVSVAGSAFPSTPHARGSTAKAEAERKEAEVYPACAGIHPISPVLELEVNRLPRMRGDPPSRIHSAPPIQLSTPHARGSTAVAEAIKAVEDVYPACAGIHLNNKNYRKRLQGLPRMRGDPPFIIKVVLDVLVSTPHARGSTPP